MKTSNLRIGAFALLVASVLCTSCMGVEETSNDTTEGNSENQVFIGGSFDSALSAIDQAADTGDIEFMQESWKFAINKLGVQEISRDYNKLQLLVLVAENLYTMSPEHRAETSHFLFKLADSGDPRHREMSALSLDSVTGRASIDVLIRLTEDSDQRVAKFALQSLKSKQSAASFSNAFNKEIEDPEYLDHAIQELCRDEGLVREAGIVCPMKH